MVPGWVCLVWRRKVANEEIVRREKSGNFSWWWKWNNLNFFQADKYDWSVLGDSACNMWLIDRWWRCCKGWFTGMSVLKREVLGWVTGLHVEPMSWISARQNRRESQQFGFWNWNMYCFEYELVTEAEDQIRRLMKGINSAEFDLPLLMQNTVVELSQWKRMFSEAHSFPHRVAVTTIG